MEICGILLDLNHSIEAEILRIEHIKNRFPNALLIGFLISDFNFLGSPSKYNKYHRTQVALQHSIDLIIEIPNLLTLQTLDQSTSHLAKLIQSVHVTQLFLLSESMQTEFLYQMAKLPIQIDRLKQSSFNLKNSFDVLSYLHGPFYFNDLVSIGLLRTLDFTKTNIHFIKFNPLENEISSLKDYYPYLRSFIHLSSSSNLQKVYGVPNGFAKKLKIANHEYTNYDNFFQSLITKYTQFHHIQKSLIQIMAQNYQYNINSSHDSYIRILGFTSKGQAYLRELKKQDLKNISVFHQLPLRVRAFSLQLITVYGLPFTMETQKDILKLELGSPIKKD